MSDIHTLLESTRVDPGMILYFSTDDEVPVVSFLKQANIYGLGGHTMYAIITNRPQEIISKVRRDPATCQSPYLKVTTAEKDWNPDSVKSLTAEGNIVLVDVDPTLLGETFVDYKTTLLRMLRQAAMDNQGTVVLCASLINETRRYHYMMAEQSDVVISSLNGDSDWYLHKSRNPALLSKRHYVFNLYTKQWRSIKPEEHVNVFPF